MNKRYQVRPPSGPCGSSTLLVAVILIAVSFSGCAVAHKVGHGFKVAIDYEFALPYKKPCNVTEEQFQSYACAHYGLCSGHAVLWSEAGEVNTVMIREVVAGRVRGDCAFSVTAMKVEFCPRVK